MSPKCKAASNTWLYECSSRICELDHVRVCIYTAEVTTSRASHSSTCNHPVQLCVPLWILLSHHPAHARVQLVLVNDLVHLHNSGQGRPAPAGVRGQMLSATAPSCQSWQPDLLTLLLLLAIIALIGINNAANDDKVDELLQPFVAAKPGCQTSQVLHAVKSCHRK